MTQDIIGDEYRESVDIVNNDIMSKYGFDIESIQSVSHDIKKIIPVSPLFDMRLNGGVPEGSTVLLSGPPKCGKTTLALQIALGGQQLDGRPTYYFDIEGRFKEMNLHTVKGLDPSGVKLIRSKKGKIISGDMHLNIAYDVITTVPGAIVILDSTSQVCSSGELEEDITGSIRASGPKLMSFFTRKISPVLCVQNATVIMIQHIIADTGRSMKTKAVSGGNKIQYQGDINLECAYTQDWKDGDKLIGKISHWNVVTSALGAPTGKFESKIRFGVGLDKTEELITLARDYGLIAEKGGANCEFLMNLVNKDHIVTKYAVDNGVVLEKLHTKTAQAKLKSVFSPNGLMKIIKFFDDNPHFYQILEKSIKDLFK